MQIKLRIPKLALIVALTTLATSAKANLITNGDFESNTLPGGAPSGWFATIYAGQTYLTGWTVGGVSVDLLNSCCGSITNHSVDMLGTPGAGSLSQTIVTTVGQQYLLSFDLGFNTGGNNGGQLTPELLGVSLNGGAANYFYGTNPYSSLTMNFIADSNSTLIRFSSATSGYSGAILDNVTVTEVPEPGTVALMIAGLGLIFVSSRRRIRSLGI